MKNNFIFPLIAAALILFSPLSLSAQGILDSYSQSGLPSQLPLKKVVILTSGLAYFEHSGSLNGSVSFAIPFKTEAVNDALMSLVINDPSSANPSVTYQSENTLYQTLRSLSVDLSDNPDLTLILSRLTGAEVELSLIYSSVIPQDNGQFSVAADSFTGRIMGVEYRQNTYNNTAVTVPYILLRTAQGIRAFPLSEINTVKFTNPAIEQDLNRALDLLAASRSSNTRDLFVNLPVTGVNARRNVTISYVIPSPVWKVSYRLDLGADKPLFQGWAIVDNDSDTDWNNVELSLVAGRPSSFIQNLYPPYYVSRQVLPLAIAGAAEAVTYDRAAPAAADRSASAPESGAVLSRARAENEMVVEQSYLQSSVEEMIQREMLQTASGSAVGGQFQFTIRNPVTLNRRMSAMLPLVESQIEARSVLVYSGRGRYPRLGAEITNTSGMKLPAGPITVYDGGVYAGDALIEFWNENEKRLISFADDLSITASVTDTNTRVVSAVNVSGGIMTINNNQIFTRTYTFINSGSDAKQLIVEHVKYPNSELVSPAAPEQTVSAYRFNITLAAGRETALTVNEQIPVSQRISLLSQRPETLLSYSTNREIPEHVRQALQQAIQLKQAADNAAVAARDIEAQRARLVSDQDRIRRNLEAAGSQTPQGQDYLQRLVALDGEIDTITTTLDRAASNARAAQQAYENYLNTLNM
jgi:soluble cytochrome b562